MRLEVTSGRNSSICLHWKDQAGVRRGLNLLRNTSRFWGVRHREGREDFKLSRVSKQPACLGSQLAGLPQTPQLSIPDVQTAKQARKRQENSTWGGRQWLYQPSQEGERGFTAGMWAAALLNSDFTEPKPRFTPNTSLGQGARQQPGQRSCRARLCSRPAGGAAVWRRVKRRIWRVRCSSPAQPIPTQHRHRKLRNSHMIRNICDANFIFIDQLKCINFF